MIRNNSIICFFGMDGSGKSTLSKNLFNELEAGGHKVTLTWWLEGESTIIRRAIRAFAGNNKPKVATNKPVNRKGTKASMLKYPYLLLVLTDYTIFGIRKTWLPGILNKNRVFIFDRYMYDVIMALSIEYSFSYRIRNQLYKFYNLLLPKPDIIFFVKVSPEISYSRKPEEILSIENAEKIKKDSEDLFTIIGELNAATTYNIDNSSDIEHSKEQIRHETIKLLEKIR